MKNYLQQWTKNPTKELLAGMVGTFALIPEVIAFSYVAGVSPEVGLFASFIISIAIAITGGCPGMISGAAGSVALVAASLVHTHGVAYLQVATIFAGMLQIAFGCLKMHTLMRFVSKSVRTGFVNALAIMIFAAQLPQMLHVSWQTYMLIGIGLVVIYSAPKISTVIPSPLICILIITVISFIWPMPVAVVSDLGTLPTGLPEIILPHVPFDLETFKIVAPYALAMAAVGVLESLMTASVVDDITDGQSNKRMEATGLGISNFAVGIFGGIAGCGMIGQTVGNLRYGGRGRLSTGAAGAFLLLFMVLAHPLVARVPVAALVAIMIMVSVSTFSWSSLRDLALHPKGSSFVMLATVAVVVATHDLAAGVGVGVLISGVLFASKMSKMLSVTSIQDQTHDKRTYIVSGQIFFASADQFFESFDFHDTARNVAIDISNAHFWDISAVASLDRTLAKFRDLQFNVSIVGVDTNRHGFVGTHAKDELLAT